MVSTGSARSVVEENIPSNQPRQVDASDVRLSFHAVIDALETASPSILQYSPAGDGVTDDRAAFIAADGAGPRIHITPGRYRIASSVNISAVLHFAPGAVLVPDAGVVINLGGEILAGFWQIFDCAQGGSITGKVKNQHILPDWWGGKPDVAANQSPYINWAIGFAQIGGRTLYLRDGLWRCDETIFVREPASIIGDPGAAAQGVTTNMSVLDFSNAPGSVNGLVVGRDIDFPLDGASFRDFAIYRSSLAATGSGGAGLVFKSVMQGECHNLLVWNWDVGYAIRGSATFPSAQCEFRACRAQYAASRHWQVSEAIDCLFERCFGGGGPAQYCVNIFSSITVGAPNALHFNGCIFVSPDSDVGIRMASGFYNLIENCVFEEMNVAGVLVDLASVDISLISLSVVDCGFNGCGDGFLSTGAAGNFRIRDNRIESSPAANMHPIEISTTGTAAFERDIMISGNSLKCTGSNSTGIRINNVSGATIRDNRVTCAGPAAANAAITLGANTSAIRVSGTRSLTTFATADGISNSGTGNVISDNSKFT
jgi:hypothetical protein